MVSGSKSLSFYLICFVLCRVKVALGNENSSNLLTLDFADNFFADGNFGTEKSTNFFAGKNLTGVGAKGKVDAGESSSILKIARTPSNRSAVGDNDSAPEPVKTDYVANLFKVYNIALVDKVRLGKNQILTNSCRQNMITFLEALEKYQLWALKVVDASGRYAHGFFWGNNYWAGSEALCKNIGLTRKHYSYSGVVTESNAKNTVADEESPFPVGFYKIKAELQLPRQLEIKKSILIGVCAPNSCDANDIKIILNMSLPRNSNKTAAPEVKILDVRTPHNIYHFWKDKTFWILFTVSLVVLAFLIAGTLYDLTRVKKYRKVSQSRIVFAENYLRSGKDKVSLKHVLDCASDVTARQDLNASDSIAKLDDNSNAVDTPEGSSITSDLHFELWQKVLLSFSLRKNIKTICDREVSVDTIPVIHGLKALSMAWVILGHTCIIIFKYADNMEFRTAIEKEFFFQTVTNGTFSVDTFFFISGLLVSFLYFRTMAKIDIRSITGGKGLTSNLLQFLGLIGYRYGRLTAPYLFVLGVVQISMKSFYYNSVFDTPTIDHENCPKYWWRNALYINTLFPVNQMCMIWSWYLSDDTQFYVLGIILLILSISHIKTAAALVLTFLFSSWVTTAYVAYANHHLPSQDDPLALFDKIYDKPWTRLGPYLIGMIVGWILFKTNCKIKMNKLVLTTGWLLSTLGMLSLIYGLYEAKLNLLTSSAYSSLSHSTWAISLAWVIIACSTGHGGIVHKILASSIFYPFSRVTYCAYLIHPIIIRYMIINLDSPLHINKEIVMILFLGQMVASYTFSFLISLAFEAPVVSLLRIISPTKSERSVR